MDDKMIQKNEEVEVDLGRLLQAVWRRIWLVALAAVVATAIALVGTLMFITPQYQSSAKFYVNNGSLSLGGASISLSASDISASKGLVNTYIVILGTRETLNDVIDYAGVDITYTELREIVTAAAVDNTEIFQVTVTHPDPIIAEKLANAIAHILPKRIDTIVEGTSAKVAEAAVVASSPSSPNYVQNSVIGLVVGAVLAVAAIVIRELVDVTVRAEEDIARVCNHPVLAAVSDMTAPAKGGHYQRAGYGGRKQPADSQQEPKLIGNDISFAASEAYKLLRTKLQYSFADESNSRVIGISSALTGEGKSLTAINLAHSLAQLDKKVLLVDCDMRRPSLSTKLPISKRPGLSGYLTSQNHLDELVQDCGIEGDEYAFKVIASGQNPPNPIELLSSARMSRLLGKLRDAYDYIILDLPPVSEVSDSLAVAKMVDGILLVVRQHYCQRPALGAAVRQFAFVDGRILGIVYNCTIDDSGHYGYYKRYYRKYYGRYGHKYEGSYLATKKQPTKTSEKGSE
ncbi:MAG: polysaccharide biosynthesis tyrosine autokinase [Oscillospiraceae bacterium]|nr:polysaccharide biosynthesis tyrosine autokinase [Oscillospiraceae bacterium]